MVRGRPGAAGHRGTEPQEPLPELMELVEKANADDRAVRIDVRTLDQALVTVPAGTVTTWDAASCARARARTC